MPNSKMRVAFIHPDLGIGGAERLVVDTALGLQKLGHKVAIFTSHHDPQHCFEETRDGTLTVKAVPPPLPRAVKGRFHILFAHLRQIHLLVHFLLFEASQYDVFFLDLLSTGVPILRRITRKRVVFYCHFPDKLMSDGAYVEGVTGRGMSGRSLLKWLYRLPMDWLEELTTSDADRILANSHFTKRIISQHLPSVGRDIVVAYPGINLDAYAPLPLDQLQQESIYSERPTFISLNRFEKKKNVILAVKAFAKLKELKHEHWSDSSNPNSIPRLVLGGGYDPRLLDNVETIREILETINDLGLSYTINEQRFLPQAGIMMQLTPPLPFPSPSSLSPATSTPQPDIFLLLNFTTSQRSTLLTSPSTLCLLYTPANEHFGIGPVEGMACGLPVLACDSGGPCESIIGIEDHGLNQSDAIEVGTGFLRPPKPSLWALMLAHILSLPTEEREKIGERGRKRAREHFGMETMAAGVERALVEAKGMGVVRYGYAERGLAWVLAFWVMWNVLRLVAA